jgi:hypothetical protein
MYRYACMHGQWNDMNDVPQPFLCEIDTFNGNELVAGSNRYGGSGGSLEPPGPFHMHLHTVYMAYSECLSTHLSPLAERTCFSQADRPDAP